MRKSKLRITKFIRHASKVRGHAWYECKTWMGRILIVKKPIVGNIESLTEIETNVAGTTPAVKPMQNLSILGRIMLILRKTLCKLNIHRWLPIDTAGNWKCFYCKIERKRA